MCVISFRIHRYEMLRCLRGIGCEVIEVRVTMAGLYGHDNGL
jgi:hypothetical protein